nr:inositol polyphosphate multikinase [Quercus suber]
MAHQPTQSLDASSLKAFENAAAGHDGVLSDESGELIIKPCTNDELEFYQQTTAQHPDFAALMPAFMGTLQLGAPAAAETSAPLADHELLTQARDQQHQQQKLHGAKIPSTTAVVLENLEHGFTHPNVLDLKLGARLYAAESTRVDKAQRLDQVSAETTSGSLNFRIAGMKVWNGAALDVYDKFYGRGFTAETVAQGFTTFFEPLRRSLARAETEEVLCTVRDEVAKVRGVLERAESRMYSASVLVVYEGDGAALRSLMEREKVEPEVVERTPTNMEAGQSEENDEEDEEEEEEETEEPAAFKVKMIDFAHAQWTPGLGADENVIKGLKNIEAQLDSLISSSGVA